MTSETVIFILIYALTLLLSVTETIPISLAALVGALLTAWFGLSYGLFTYDEAAGFIDMRLIALLVGTMIVVEVAAKSGLFRFLALYAIKVAGGNPPRLFLTLNVTAATVSLFLSDPTAMLLMAAAITTIAKLLDYDPVPYFISAAVMINLGGTSTLIGSVSNMVIGIEAGLSFSDFIGYLVLCEIALWILTILTLYLLFRSRLGKRKPLPSYDPWEGVENRKVLHRSALILMLLLVLFIVLDRLGVGAEAVALGCAILALAFSEFDPAEIFKRLDWETVFFIAGFFFVVRGLERTGILASASQQLIQLAGGNQLNVAVLTIWSSGIASTVVSNTAVSLTFIPVIRGLAGFELTPLWAALILGTNLGGVATPLSGTVSVMAIGTLKREGIRASFKEFTKAGAATTLVQLCFATLYLIMRFGLRV